MKKPVLLVVLFIFLSRVCFCQIQSEHLKEWQDNKYSMFIHFGIYSELGGVWKDRQIAYGYSEQIQSHAGIFSDEYAQVAERFLPTKWNADSIALLAKQAGMRSVIITSKHHDGFCMFKTQTTNFNIADATPFQRDVIKELSEACKRHGLNFGLYFSLIDWHYPQAYPISSHNADFITPEHHEYNKKQLQELLTNYGDISEIWFDMGSLTIQQSAELRALVKKFQPDCLISGRLGNDQGEFCVMGDNEYPNYTINTPWETPASMYNETWGYRSWQKNVPLEEKVSEKLLSLVKTVTRGGSYILNIGPKGDGSVPEFEQNVLLQIGNWLKINGEAVYNTKPIKLMRSPAYGEMTTRDNKIYFFLFNTPANNQVVVKGLASKISKVFPLDIAGKALTYHQNSDSLTISLPDAFLKNDVIRVIVLESEGKILLKTENTIAFKSPMVLNSRNAQHSYSFSGIDYYSSYRSTVQYAWNLHTSSTTQKVQPTILYTDEEKGREAVLTIDDKKFPISFSGDESVSLNESETKWGAVAICGQLSGFIDHLNGDGKDVDIKKKWGGKDWIAMDNWTNNISYKKPAGMFQNWYWLQEITSAVPTQILVRTPTNDGVSVYLNGEELYIVNNPAKDTTLQSTVLLPLKAGTNKLLVKYFNRFERNVRMGVFTNVPQVLYKKLLPEVSMEKNKTFQVSLQLPQQYPVHQNIHAPNCIIQLK